MFDRKDDLKNEYSHVYEIRREGEGGHKAQGPSCLRLVLMSTLHWREGKVEVVAHNTSCLMLTQVIGCGQSITWIT